jgi:Ribonuclease G/E
MTLRRLYLDEAPGERRGVVTLDGSPERLLISRLCDIAVQQAGAMSVVRVRRVDRTLNTAFLDMGEGPDAVLALAGASKLFMEGVREGAWLAVKISAPARREKGAVASLVGPSEGPARLIEPAPDLAAQLAAFAPGVEIVGGAVARAAADIAEDVALTVEHSLRGGGRLFIESTRALTAVDVDLGAATGESRRATVRANREAVATAARLLRLKGLGGLVVMDLAGKGHDGAALGALARTAFAPDGEGVSIGPISRFGVFELVLPRRATPIADRLLETDGQPSAATMAFRLLRAIERAAGPGQIVQARCAPDVAEVAAQFSTELMERIGPRFHIQADASKARTEIEVAPR